MNTSDPKNPKSHPLREPETLLQNVNTSILFRALVLSLLVHVVFAGVTSFSLYRSWGEHGMFREGYGLLSPSEISEIEEAQKKKELEAEQAAEIEAELEARRRQAKLEMSQKPSEPATPEPEEAEDPPEAPEIDPLPPKEEFSLDDMPEFDL